MKDLPRIFEAYCNAQNPPIWYDYGDVSSLNLFKNRRTQGIPEDEKPEAEGQLYLLQEPLTRSFFASQTGLNFGGVSYSGAFTILVKSKQDLEYFNARRGFNSNEKSRYTKNIEPLIPHAIALFKAMLCDEYTINSYQVIDAVNFLDANRDGILVTYNLTKNAN